MAVFGIIDLDATYFLNNLFCLFVYLGIESDNGVADIYLECYSKYLYSSLAF